MTARLTDDQLDELLRLHITYEVAAEYGGAVEACAAELSAVVGRLLIANNRGGCPTPNQHWRNHP